MQSVVRRSSGRVPFLADDWALQPGRRIEELPADEALVRGALDATLPMKCLGTGGERRGEEEEVVAADRRERGRFGREEGQTATVKIFGSVRGDAAAPFFATSPSACVESCWGGKSLHLLRTLIGPFHRHLISAYVICHHLMSA
jgi:hypothetical protein